VCPGGEAVAAAADRVMEALHAIAASNPERSVAVVTHGVMARLAVMRIAGRQPGDDWQFKLDTGSATVIGTDGGRLSVLRTSDRHKADPHKAAALLTAEGQTGTPYAADRRVLRDRRHRDVGHQLAVNQRHGARRSNERDDGGAARTTRGDAITLDHGTAGW
jgi:broad specificity phosphatase PhoE